MLMPPYPTRPRTRRRANPHRRRYSQARPWSMLAPKVQTQLAQHVARVLRTIREHETCHADDTD
jgi:hypothetical protein